MPIIACPHCGTELSAPDNVLGQEVVCGRCNRPFVAQRTAPAPAGAAAPPGPQPAGGPSPPPARPTTPPPGPAGVPPPPRVAPPGSPGVPPPVPPPVGYMSPPGFVTAPRTSGFAVASLVLGIASIVTCWCYGISSLICGILALVFYSHAVRDVSSGECTAASLGMAKAGRICAFIGIVLGVGLWVVFFVGIGASMM